MTNSSIEKMANKRSKKSSPSILLMGVSGAGKTTIGKLIAAKLGYTFIDADDHHDKSSIRKLSEGYALTDEDRAPWLERLHVLLHTNSQEDQVVLACSALKHAYQKQLCGGPHPIALVYLHVPRDELQRRLKSRKGHFMGDALLDSQLTTLQKPTVARHRYEDTAQSQKDSQQSSAHPAEPVALYVDAMQTPEEICDQALRYLGI